MHPKKEEFLQEPDLSILEAVSNVQSQINMEEGLKRIKRVLEEDGGSSKLCQLLEKSTLVDLLAVALSRDSSLNENS